MTQAKQQSFLDDSPQKQGPVECLGLTFENDEARRAYFTEKLRQKLQDPEFRKIEGFPIGEDEDILALSDPPYYTACPNPFIEDFIKHYGKPFNPNEPYHREPFAADVSEGKNDPIYNAHSYHTKVPHKAIMRYILHYTEPGDVVFDGFCGTGMTGVAAQLCGDQTSVESLDYLVKEDGTILNSQGEPVSQLGARRAILSELSPAATFISYNNNASVDVTSFEHFAKQTLEELDKECGKLYETLHTDGRTRGKINYTVWSDVLLCPECGEDMVFWEVAVDKKTGYRKGKNEKLTCPRCGMQAELNHLDRAWITRYDEFLDQVISQVKRVPVLINYTAAGSKFEKLPDDHDIAIIEQSEKLTLFDWFPVVRMPEGDESRRNDDIGITHVHHFYTRRALYAWSLLWKKVKQAPFDIQSRVMFWLQSVALGHTYLNRYLAASFSQVNRYLKGTLYVAPFISEVSPWYSLKGKIARLKSTNLSNVSASLISTASTTELKFKDSTADYVFTDPPFGSNINYSDLNFIWESWLGVYTNNDPEAVVSNAQDKNLPDFQNLMEACFAEYYRVLKPGRWMTVEFHNSRNSVWNAIQEAILRSGFVIADVRTLDKKQMTMQQMTTSGAVRQDLIISAYKPNGGLEERFKLEAGTEDGAWDFVRTHLRQLPVFTAKNGQVEPIAERMDYLLFDRMVAFHVQRGVMVPMSAAEFYAGLDQRFPKRDEMYFLPDQVAEYDQKRLMAKEVLQLQLFVTDESSAIQWLKQQLIKKPQTFQELQPQFMREVKAWEKHEKPLELAELLEQNFLAYNGQGPIPEQIWSWLGKSSTTREQMAGQTNETADAALRNKAKDRWYVPDPSKAGDLEKLREKTLLKEFEEYCESKQKRLRVFRLEAVRAGFKKAWQERDYPTIIQVAEKIPDNVLQEDPKLLMWYDQARTRMEM